MRSRRSVDTGVSAGTREPAKRIRKVAPRPRMPSATRLAPQARGKQPTKSISRANAETSATLTARGGVQKPFAVKTLEDLAKRIRICIKCPLHASRTLAVPGEGKATAKVMIVGEGPGKQEDQTGRPFVGNAGRYLDHVLEGTPFTREDFFITNIVKCRPPSNRTPTTDEAETCTSLYLSHQIKLLNPRLIFLLGSTAVKRMVGLKSVEEARGKVIKRDGRKYLASYHPAVRFYREDLAQKIKEDFALLKSELAKL